MDSSTTVTSEAIHKQSSVPETQHAAFTHRRGNIKFSSAKYSAVARTRKTGGGLLSFRSTRRTAPRPTRVKGIFENVLNGFNEGIDAIREIANNMKLQLPSLEDEHTSTRQHYYMELEKNLKTLERKTRSLEVQKDRIEELKDEYFLKLKLKDGALNLAQALSNRPSKGAKEKLIEARLEAKELSEDLCDIEEELETKLGVFKVHITGFSTLPRTTVNGEVIETQLKLSSQKWKARCKIGRHNQQLWQDNDIFFLCKLTDELFLKVVEVKRIQGNNYIGSMKCQTREFFSFFPQTVMFTLPIATTQTIKLNMDVRWSPVIGDDFLSDLELKKMYCYVGSSSLPGPNRLSNVSKTHVKERRRSREGSVEKLRLHSESPQAPRRFSNSGVYRNDVRQEKVRPKSTSDLTGKKIIVSPDILAGQDKGYMFENSYSQPSPERSASPVITQRHYRSNSTGSRTTAMISLLDTRSATPPARTPQNISLSSLVESVLSSLEEPRELYAELKALEVQLLRLQTAFKGGRLTKAPSVTLSESSALDSFDFLESDDYPQSSQLSQITEGLKTGSFSDFISLQDDEPLHKANSDSLAPLTLPTPSVTTNGILHKDTIGSSTIDRILLQHLLHCEYLLQHLQSIGPLNHKLTIGLKKLYHEAEIIRDLLNYAADIDNMPKLEQILPELSASDHLLQFWKSVSAKDDVLCVSCELFVIALDEKYGQTLWNEFPEIANKVFSELLSRVLDLEGDGCDPVENKMSVTAFQFAAYFLKFGSTKAIPKALKEIAQEMSITEGIRDGDIESRRRITSLLPTYPFNHGALLATAYLLSDIDRTLRDAAVAYLSNFAGNSPWRAKAIQYYIEALENSDQAVRIGACIALGQLKADTAIEQLRHLAKVDFPLVKDAANNALVELGDDNIKSKLGKIPIPEDLILKKQLVQVKEGRTKLPLQRTRSAESALLDSNELRTRL